MVAEVVSSVGAEPARQVMTEKPARCQLMSGGHAGHSIEAFVSLDANPDVPGVQMPTMGIWPTGDHYCLETQMLASEDKVPKGCWRYEKLQSASHWAPRDEPERVASLLLDFFKQDFPGF